MDVVFADATVTNPSFRFFQTTPILPGFGLSIGFSVLYLTFIILIPISALFIYISGMTWEQYWFAITDARVVHSYWVTLQGAFYSTVAVSIIGFIFAWILSRYDFWGRNILNALMDLPFALPTAVAGITLSALFIPTGTIGQWLAPLGIQISYAFPGIVVAMTFTSLPFIVRALQPILEDADTTEEEAAMTLGASNWTIFTRVIFPTIIPAFIAGASQAFIRSLGEFGAVIMIAGNIPFQTEVSSLMIFVRLQEFNHAAAAAIASVILVASLMLLFILQFVQTHFLAKK